MKRRLTLRDETGRAILNCYACKTEGRMICDYFSCQQRLIDRLADFEDADLEYGGMGVMNAVQLLDWLQQPAEGE